jgi:hypothetical protein
MNLQCWFFLFTSKSMDIMAVGPFTRLERESVSEEAVR